MTLATSRDTACTSSFPGGATIAILESRVAKQAGNGSVRMQSNTWTYTPKRGFSGRDNFTLERNVLKDGQLYVMYLQVAMDVR